MSKSGYKSIKAILTSMALGVCLVAGGMIANPVLAQEEDAEQQTLSPNVAKGLGEAYALGQEQENYTAAIAKLDQVFAQRGGSMTAFEKATAYEMRGTFKVQIKDYNGALRDLEAALAQNALSVDRVRQIRYYIAQLYFQEERYAEAARYLQEYINFQRSTGETVNANTYYLLGAAYAAMEDWRSARSPLEQAIRSGSDRKQSWYELLSAVYYNLGDESARGDLLVRMIGYWPNKKIYWEQLAGAYSTAGRESDAAAVLELAYRAGLIQDADKIIALVQYYSVLDNPYRGGKLLSKEMAAGNIPVTQQNLELLAQMWNLAREQKKAADALERAAAMAPSGKLYYRLGQVYFADEQWAKSEETMRKALARGGLTSKQVGDAWLLIGNAQYNIDTESDVQRNKAKDSWRKATNYSGSRKAANGWIEYVRSIQRIECQSCDVERKRAERRYNEEKERCQTNIDIFDRVGSAAAQISEADIAACRALLESTYVVNTGIITYKDGTTEERVGQACRIPEGQQARDCRAQF